MVELAQKEKERKKTKQIPKNTLLPPSDHCNFLDSVQHFYTDLLMQVAILIEISPTNLYQCSF